jgi:hypothetical protein
MKKMSLQRSCKKIVLAFHNVEHLFPDLEHMFYILEHLFPYMEH